MCLNPHFSTTHWRYTRLEQGFLIGSYLLVWYCLSRCLAPPWAEISGSHQHHLHWKKHFAKICCQSVRICLLGKLQKKKQGCAEEHDCMVSAHTFVAHAGEMSAILANSAFCHSRNNCHCRCLRCMYRKIGNICLLKLCHLGEKNTNRQGFKTAEWHQREIKKKGNAERKSQEST